MYELEQVGQAVCSTFIGEWFLFGIHAAVNRCTGMHSLRRTSTPCRRQGAGPPSTTRDRFAVWQMTFPSTARRSFSPVIKHLAGVNGVCVVNSSCGCDLSLSTSLLTNVAENSAAESDHCTSQLCLSCDEWNASTEQSAELSFCDETAGILLTPQTSTCAVKSFVGGSNCMHPVHSSFSCSSDIRSCQSVSSVIFSPAQFATNTVTIECELETSFNAGTVHLPTTNRILIESYELFDVTDNSSESATNTEGCYLAKDFGPEITVSSVLKKRGSDVCITESSTLCSGHNVPVDFMSNACSDFTEFALDAEHSSVLFNSCISESKQLGDSAVNCKRETVNTSVSCGWCIDTYSTDNKLVHYKSEADVSIIAGISQLGIDAAGD